MAYTGKARYGSTAKKTYVKEPIVKIPLGEINPSIQQESFFNFVSTGNGNGLLEALAGTGKTTTILHGTKYAKGTCLYICFNRDIMLETQKKAPEGVEVSTLHSLGLKVIAKAIGRFPKVDKNKMDIIIKERFPNVPDKAIGLLLKAVSICKNTMSLDEMSIESTCIKYDFTYDSDEYGFDAFISDVKKLMDYSKMMPHIVDFDDMLFIPVVNGYAFPSFDNIFGDEAQDFNKVQMEMILLLAQCGGRIFIVGDPNQAIYAFRGAHEGALGELAKILDCKRFPLTVTYRCPQSVVNMANIAVPEYQAHPSNPVGSVQEVQVFDMLEKTEAGDIIISRKNAPLVTLAFRFLADKKRAFIRGRDFGDGLIAIVKKFKGNSISDFQDFILTWETKEEKKLIAKFGDEANTSLINDKADCLRSFALESDSIHGVISMIENLFKDLNDSTAITLSSCHRAKGLEYNSVWMISNTFNMNSVEEKNLWYVAVTRAKKDLYMVKGEIKQKEIVEFV